MEPSCFHDWRCNRVNLFYKGCKILILVWIYCEPIWEVLSYTIKCYKILFHELNVLQELIVWYICYWYIVGRMTFLLCHLGSAGLVGKWWTSPLSWWGWTHRSTLTFHLQVPLVEDALEEWREGTKGLLLRRQQVEMEMRKMRIRLLMMSF